LQAGWKREAIPVGYSSFRFDVFAVMPEFRVSEISGTQDGSGYGYRLSG
jgi:hypothetical protein